MINIWYTLIMISTFAHAAATKEVAVVVPTIIVKAEKPNAYTQASAMQLLAYNLALATTKMKRSPA